MSTTSPAPPSPGDSPAPDPTMNTLTGVAIASVGASVPEELVRNEDLASLGYDADWIVQRTGIRERRRAAEGIGASDLAVTAAEQCVERAGISATDVDLIIVATMTPDTTTPSAACHLQRKLGATAPSFDVNAACAGFMYALVSAAQFVKTGCSQNALVVGVDLMSRMVNPADKKTFPLFGDGAGALLLQPGKPDQGLTAYTLGADGQGAELLFAPAGGSCEPLSLEGIKNGRQFLQMEGLAVFKWAVRKVAESIRATAEAAGLTPQDIDLFALHQANVRILDAVADELGVERERIWVNLDRYGNTSAASIPLVLEEAHSQGKIQRGDHVVTCGFGAGLTWGSALINW